MVLGVDSFVFLVLATKSNTDATFSQESTTNSKNYSTLRYTYYAKVSYLCIRITKLIAIWN